MSLRKNSDVVVVTEKDRVVGYREKFEAHKHPVPLHRAISVVIYDPERKMTLLQQRAKGKPTWPLHWSNTCCTHPYPDESYEDCASRRLKEEMGIVTPLIRLFSFVYDAKYDETWGEHEYDVIFDGTYVGKINADPDEVADNKWVSVKYLRKDILKHPEIYTPWLKIILGKL